MNLSTTSPNPRGSTHAKHSDWAPIRSSSFRGPPSLKASERKLTFFALCLAIIEKTEYGFCKLAFFGAFVVFKGYGSALKPIEFLFVFGIFLVQCTRIFSPKATCSHPLTPLTDYMLQRMGLPKEAQLLLIFVPKLFHWLQILAATVCVTFSLMRLGQQNFEEEALNNQKFVLVVFYIIVLVEALLSLWEKCYWTWNKKLFKQLMEELELGPNGTIFLHLFFNDAHSKCISGNFFDGLKMDLISFAEKLIHANSLDDQIIGAEMLITLKL